MQREIDSEKRETERCELCIARGAIIFEGNVDQRIRRKNF